MANRTPLYDMHLAAGARMTPFAGWDMPVHYGSQIEEHHAVRRDAGMFDVSHMLGLDVAGPTAGEFLRGLLANDVARLREPGMAQYTCMLNDDGGIVDDLVVMRTSDDAYRVVCNAGCADKDLARIRSLASGMRAPPSISPRRDLALIAVQGPRAADRLLPVLPRDAATIAALSPFRAAAMGEWLVGRTGYTGEDGFEIAAPAEDARRLWSALAAAGVTPAGLGARDTLRLEAGLPLYGQDMDEDITPDECGLAWTVARSDARAFRGREALAARTPRFRRAGLVGIDPGIMRSHMAIDTPEGAGETTSGGFSPTLQRSIAFGRVPPALRDGVDVGVKVRDRTLNARVVPPRFVRHGKSLLEEIPRS